MRNFISKIIANRILKLGILCKPAMVNNIIDAVLKYNCSINIIYDEYEIIDFKMLNSNEIRYSKEMNLYSYTNDSNFKYNELETLIFDIKVIRKAKLKIILK